MPVVEQDESFPAGIEEKYVKWVEEFVNSPECRQNWESAKESYLCILDRCNTLFRGEKPVTAEYVTSLYEQSKKDILRQNGKNFSLSDLLFVGRHLDKELDRKKFEADAEQLGREYYNAYQHRDVRRINKLIEEILQSQI